MMIRIQKHIANMGICSRRKAELLIKEGKVLLNGEKVTEMGVKVDPEKDVVEVVGLPPSHSPLEGGRNVTQLRTRTPEHVYILLHKPIDYITSASSEQGASVMDLLTKENNYGNQKRACTERVYPVGRLDKDSEGLVLLTNDGDLTNKLTHPRYEHEKEYEVTIGAPLTKEATKVLEKGMIIDGDTAVQGITLKKSVNKGKKTVVTVVLKEGKNRQIRKMFGTLGYPVLALKRIRMGKLKLNVLPVGRWKYIKKDSIV